MEKWQVCFASPTYWKKASIFNYQLLFVKFNKFICGENYGRKQEIALCISGSMLLFSVSGNPSLGKICLRPISCYFPDKFLCFYADFLLKTNWSFACLPETWTWNLRNYPILPTSLKGEELVGPLTPTCLRLLPHSYILWIGKL